MLAANLLEDPTQDEKKKHLERGMPTQLLWSISIDVRSPTVSLSDI
jgi:hypothetical protein